MRKLIISIIAVLSMLSCVKQEKDGYVCKAYDLENPDIYDMDVYRNNGRLMLDNELPMKLIEDSCTNEYNIYKVHTSINKYIYVLVYLDDLK